MTKTIISVVVVAIVIMAIAVPVISGAGGATTETKENSYSYRATLLDTSTGDHNLTFNYSDKNVSINGVDLGVIGQTANLVGPEVIINWNTQTSALSVYNYAENVFDYVSKSNTSQTMTISNGTWTGEGGKTVAIDSIIVPSEDGELGAMSSGRVSPGATCYWSNYVRYAYNMIGSGDPWQPDQIKVYATTGYSAAGAWSGAPSSVQTSDVGKTSMTVGSLVFDDAVLSTFNSASLVYVPIEYTETTDGVVTGTVKTLIDMIPLLMIVGLMVAVVAAYIVWRQ